MHAFWSFGFMPFLVAIVLVVLVLLRFFIDEIFSNRPTRVRRTPFVVVVAVIGFFIGGMLQPSADRLLACHDQGKPFAACLLPFGT